MSVIPARKPRNAAISTLGLQRKLREREREEQGAFMLLAALVLKTGVSELSAEDVAQASGKKVRLEGDGVTVRIMVREKGTHGN